jgi:hypothetical protein
VCVPAGVVAARHSRLGINTIIQLADTMLFVLFATLYGISLAAESINTLLPTATARAHR